VQQIKVEMMKEYFEFRVKLMRGEGTILTESVRMTRIDVVKAGKVF